MIPRYSKPEMAAIWKDVARWRYILEIETEVAFAQEQRGEVPGGTAEAVRAKVQVDDDLVAKALEYEQTLKHDVIAFLTAVAERAGEPARHLHKGLTSSDVLDTATAMQIMDAGELLMNALSDAIVAVKAKALEHKDTLCIGRTHGIHAEPTTFGLKLLGWLDDLCRCHAHLDEALNDAYAGAISGAVGTHATVSPDVEESALHALGLDTAGVSTQVISRDRIARVISEIGLLGSCIERFAVEVRHLQQTDVREVREGFTKGQKGSSAMPHKRNPILTENLTGQARLLRSYVMPALENIALWYERDISHSSVERVILPDAFILCHFMLSRFTGVVKNLVVDEGRMMHNLESSGRLWASQRLLLALVEGGCSREEAYALVQPHALAVWDEGGDLYDRIGGDEVIMRLMRLMESDELEEIFDPYSYVEHRDETFERVFDEHRLVLPASV